MAPVFTMCSDRLLARSIDAHQKSKDYNAAWRPQTTKPHR